MRAKIIIAVITAGVIAAFAWHMHFAKSPANRAEAVAEQYQKKAGRVAAEGKVAIAPGFDVELGSELEGRITEFPVKEGDMVKKGEVIARLDGSTIRAELAEAEARLAASKAKLSEMKSGSRPEEIESAAAGLASAAATLEFEKSSLARYRKLYRENAVSKEFLEENERDAAVAEANVEKAREKKFMLEKGPRRDTIEAQENLVKMDRASVEYYKTLLGKCSITAPISGRLVRKYLQAGECVTKNMVLAEIADMKEIRINADVDETDIGGVRIGDRAEITSDAWPGHVFTGYVEEIASRAGKRRVQPNPAQIFDEKVVRVRIRPDDKTRFPFKPGMDVDVKIAPEGMP